MLFIFDWDGTISDSTGRITLCMQKAAKDVGLAPLQDHEVKNIIGLGLPEAIRTLYPEATQNQADELRDRYSEHFIEHDTRPSSFFPGAMETLERLKARGNILAVATGKSRKGLDRVLSRLALTDFFDATRCADETASKPHPLMLEELINEFGVSLNKAVMIGDTEYDMAMALEIGMPKVAVTYGAHHINRLIPYKPEMCIDHFAQLLDWQF